MIGIIPLIGIVFYLALLLLAVIGGPIFLFFSIRSFKKGRSYRGWIYLVLVCVMILPAPLFLFLCTRLNKVPIEQMQK